MASGSPFSIGLAITARDGSTRDATLTGESILVGSGPSAVLRLEGADVSSIHAVIKLTPEKTAAIIDLGSETGTTVNGKTVTDPMPLEIGDEISIGRARLAVRSLSGVRSGASIVPRSEVPTVETLRDVGDETEIDEQPPSISREEPTTNMNRKDEITTPRAGDAMSASFVTATSPFDRSLLEKPLAKEYEPTAEQRVLEIRALWGTDILDEVQVSEPRPVTVGGRGHASWMTKQFGAGRPFDLELEGNLPADVFTIAENHGGEATIIIPTGASLGLRTRDGQITNDVALKATDAPFPAKAYALRPGDRLVFKVDTITFVAEFVRGNAELGRRASLDWYFPRVFAISALLHVFFVAAAFITPRAQLGLVDELFKNQNRFATMILKAPEEEKKNKKLDLSGMKDGGRHKDEEGKFGKKELPKKDALASKAGAPRVDPNKREKDRKIALNAGLLGVLKGEGAAGAVSNVFGPGGLGTGINNAMGGLRGTAMGDAGGAGGLGTRGTGAGGGGDSLGIGGLGTHGHGRGTGGYGNIDLGGRGKGTMQVVPGKTIVEGSLSKEEIGRVIRRNLARFKYCYEKQLNANPNLAGKISVYFTIAPTGSVAEATIRETTMNEPTVEDCVGKVMQSLVFPQPRGGGIVVVTYPFVFAAT